MFEIVVCVRDSQGKDTGKKKSFVTNSAYKMWEFWSKNTGSFTPRNKKSASNLPDADEAQSILNAIYNS